MTFVQSALIFAVNTPKSTKYDLSGTLKLQSVLIFVANVPKSAKTTFVILDFYSVPPSIVTKGLDQPRICQCYIRIGIRSAMHSRIFGMFYFAPVKFSNQHTLAPRKIYSHVKVASMISLCFNDCVFDCMNGFLPMFLRKISPQCFQRNLKTS